jgi:hypothetical protein
VACNRQSMAVSTFLLAQKPACFCSTCPAVHTCACLWPCKIQALIETVVCGHLHNASVTGDAPCACN